MRSIRFCLIGLFLIVSSTVSAQIGIRLVPNMGMRMGMGMRYGYGARPYGQQFYRQKRRPTMIDSTFKPHFLITIGYGFPNLDKGQFVQTYQYNYIANNYSGPLTGSLEYALSRNSAIGVSISHSKATATYYYNNGGQSSPQFYGELNNTSIMLNYKKYLYTNSEHVAPYTRSALGVNIWNERYYYPNGTTLNLSANPSELAYQLSIGSEFRIHSQSGFYIEAGYGKYILNAGLLLKL